MTYEREKILQVMALLNSLVFSGVQQARIVTELADILGSGKEGEIIEKEETKKQ